MWKLKFYKCVSPYPSGAKTREFLRHPVLTPQSSHLSGVMAKALTSGTVRHRRHFLAHVQEVTTVQQQWQAYIKWVIVWCF